MSDGGSWTAWLGAITGTLALGLSVWNASWSQRERLKVSLIRRGDHPEEAGMTRIYVHVVNLSPFEVWVDRVGLVTIAKDGQQVDHRLSSDAMSFPSSLGARQSLRMPLSMHATIYSELDTVGRAYAVTATGKVCKSPYRFRREKLSRLMQGNDRQQ